MGGIDQEGDISNLTVEGPVLVDKGFTQTWHTLAMKKGEADEFRRPSPPSEN